MNIRTSAVARLVIMGLLLLALLIPLGMVRSVVSERAARRGSVVQEVSSTWGAPQVIGGPVLMVPYVYTSTDREGKPQRCVAHAFFLPDVLDIVGTMEPLVLERGLFEAIVYKAHLRITGRFVRPDLTGIRPAPSQVFWEEATVNIGVSDPRGIAKRVTISWNGADVPLVAGVDDSGLSTSGLHMSAGGLSETSNSAIAFAVDLDVNGSRELKVLPAGSDTSLQLTSSWPHPSFSGAPLPAFRESGPSGFTGRWNVPYFGRAYPPRWTNVGLDRAQLKAHADASAVGVTLLQPVDIYQQAERAVKYAALFVVMTFVIFFLFEIVRSRLVHPVQYLFVGFALCVFYLLLVSASEHMGFDVAYASAAAATILLIGSYAVFVLGGLREGGTMAAGLTTLYAFLYLLLRLEDYALLAGSIGLFLMLALLMYSTRRINWYELRLGASDHER
jgi:inner membrane protein